MLPVVGPRRAPEAQLAREAAWAVRVINTLTPAAPVSWIDSLLERGVTECQRSLNAAFVSGP